MLVCHDWGLEGYSVTDYGQTVTLHLLRTDLGPPITRLDTIFSGVALYHFVHTQGTIILDIIETLIENIFEEYGARITEWDRLHGVSKWPGSIIDYAAKLDEAGCVGWMIYSSLGFEGFIIGKSVSQSPA
jgi:hypothetical protein